MAEDVLLVDEAFELIWEYVSIALVSPFVIKIFCIAEEHRLFSSWL